MTIQSFADGLLEGIERHQAASLVHFKRFSHENEIVRDLVRDARGEGATWQEIGDALGVTRQAAQQRYGDFVDGTRG